MKSFLHALVPDSAGLLVGSLGGRLRVCNILAHARRELQGRVVGLGLVRAAISLAVVGSLLKHRQVIVDTWRGCSESLPRSRLAIGRLPLPIGESREGYLFVGRRINAMCGCCGAGTGHIR